MDKSKKVDLDELSVGMLRCVRKLLELLERGVRTEVLQRKDTSANTIGKDGDSTVKAVANDTNTEDKAAEKPGVEDEIRVVLQVMVGTLRRIVDDLMNEEKERASPLSSLFDISVTSSDKTIPVPENTPEDANEESGGNNNDNIYEDQQTLDVNEPTDQNESVSDDKKEPDVAECNNDEVLLEATKPEDYDEHFGSWYEQTTEEISNDKTAEKECVEDENAEEKSPVEENASVYENAEGDGDEESHGEPGVEGGDNPELEDDEEDEQMDVELLSEEGSGDHHPLMEEIDPPEIGESVNDILQHEDEDEGMEAAACITGGQAAAVDDMEDDSWEPQCCDRDQSVTRDTDAAEDEDTADECAQKDDCEPSDMEYDSFFPTEDEDFLPMAEAASDEDTPEVVGLSAVRMFRKHMETDNVEVEMFPTPHNQPRRHFFYTCRVLELEAEACGRSKRAAKRNAISKIIRLIIKKQKEGSLPTQVKPFTDEELGSLAEACRGGADYLSRLRQLCNTLHAPPPSYDVQISEDGAGEKVYTVQCSALGRTAIGICAKKRSAKRHAAREIVKRYEEEAAAAKAPITA